MKLEDNKHMSATISVFFKPSQIFSTRIMCL